MKRPTSISCALLATAMTLIGSDAVAQQKTLGKIVRLDPQLDDLLAKDAEMEILAEGFTWSEGPAWFPDNGGYLLFSDIPRNSIFKWQEGKGISLFMRPSGYTGVTFYGAEPGTNGLIRDPQGRLVMCEHGDRRVSVLTKDGGKMTLADKYQGKRLNSPNDGAFKSNGDLYFTDPPYGLPQRWDDPRKELDFQGVYRLSAASRVESNARRGNGERVTGRSDHTLTLLTKELRAPNGLAFSPDEKTVYVAQSDPEEAIWKAFPVKEDGTLGESRVLFDVTEHVGKLPGLPDGLKVDKDGHLWATGPGGVWILTPEGKPLGRLDTGQRTGNCTWGDDGSTLYICADMYICRIKTKTKGAGW